MPSSAELQHSRRAICALAEYLDALVLGYPEDEPDKWDLLTVDGVLEVAGQRWAVDHVRATWEPLTTAAAEDALCHLKPRLDAIAERHQVGLHVGIYPPRGDARTAYYDGVVDLAESCAVSRRNAFDDDGLTTVQLSGNPADVSLSIFNSNDPRVGGQIADGLVPALEKKLKRQLARAKAGGYRVAVIVDQTQPDGVRHGTIPYGLPATVSNVVAPLVARASDVVDQVWLRDHAGSFHLIYQRD